MPVWKLLFAAPLLLVVLGFSIATCEAQEGSRNSQSAIKVRVSFEENQWQLYRDGSPYQIKGAGGNGPLELLAKYGGNSTRTWGVGPNTLARLNEAHANGISVTLGVWLEYESRGYDYQNYEQVNEQIEKVMEAVRKYKHHPALLMWGVGNEMEGYGSGDNPAIWHHVDHLCRLIKAEDPNHPTMTVIAEIGGNKVPAINKFCPHVDVVGINSYGGAASLPKRYKEAGGQKPYVVTEFGPAGPWEVGRDSINAAPEPPSNVKAENYRIAYSGFSQDKKFCLGSYAFLWGQKMEATTTWFGMLLEDNRRTNMVETMSTLWTGKPTENKTPCIASLTNQGANEVDAGTELNFQLAASDPEGGEIKVEWQLLSEADAYITAGDYKPNPDPIADAIIESSNESARVRAPETAGLYRLYAIVDDGTGAVATANLPFRVNLQPLDSPGVKQRVPCVLYDEPNNQESPYNMPLRNGDISRTSLEMKHAEGTKFGSNCIRFQSEAGAESDVQLVAGKAFNLMGANRLSFWAKGTTGTEQLVIGIGSESDETYFKEKTVPLTRHWKKFQLDFANVDLRKIQTGFRWSVKPTDAESTVYLDRVVIE